MDAEYKWSPSSAGELPRMKDDYERTGYVMMRGLFNSSEVQKIEQSLTADTDITKFLCPREDGLGRAPTLAVWDHPVDDPTGYMARCQRVADIVTTLFSGREAYHYHIKLVTKAPKTGGAWRWHQDYGYWYHNGCLFPDMLTMFVAIDDCTLENGCLEIVPGSHRLGRIDHVLVGGQTCADPERLALAEKSLGGRLTVEMAAGDALFFHCNVLHGSAVNTSDKRRWALLAAYNTRDNNPLYVHHHPQYTPLHTVPNDAIETSTEVFAKKQFMDTNKGDAKKILEKQLK